MASATMNRVAEKSVLARMTRKANFIDLFTERGNGCVRMLKYQTIHFPWPLTSRDLCYVGAYKWYKRDVASKERVLVG